MLSIPSVVRIVSSFVWVPLGVRASSVYKAHEKSKFMQKLINKKGAKTKKQWYKPHLGEPLEVDRTKTKKGISHGHSVRLRQLSHVLYDKITNIINTGELSQEVFEKQVSITAVKMSKDMNSVNILWNADRNDSEEVELLLMSHCGKLRSLLISYHVLGRIPHIVFVKDKSNVNTSHLTRLFDMADYGPDYIPTGLKADHISESNKQQHDCDDQIESDLEEEVDNSRAAFTDLEEKNCLEDEISQIHDQQSNVDNNFKPNSSIDKDEIDFRSDLYGLNRDDLMKKVLAKKRKPLHMSEDCNHLPSLEYDVSLKSASSLDSSFTTKSKLQRRLAKEERKLKTRMLERDSFD